MKCPNCQANLELNPALKEAYCEYCGTKIMVAGVQSANQLGQPIADAHLVEMLNAVAPILTKNESLSATLAQKNSLLKKNQQSLSRIKLPFIDNDKVDFFNAAHETKYLIVFICGIVLAAITMFIPYITALSFFLFIPAAVAMGFIYRGTHNKQIYERTIAQTQHEIWGIQEEIKDNNDKLSKYNIDAIPPKYRVGSIIDFFIDVLNNQRATNMQQAINLYENDLRDKKIEAMQEQQLENLQRIEALARENAAMKAQLNAQNKKR